ncbi:capsule assembly Wzi family protein [Geobacter sp. FeAm09]|uniref:capsule assembly Wzi family protein n=1 Tax=Geobacter sp. FeAm09 TaxID=2597769 RepID=UPI0011EC027D|nr:capsule assembly Wzi family protein [Geobacter sp. FeAm09]QEM66872.1 capsule assembly Wzi family protein [Geobacter sp. FeAm09]
MQKIVIVVLILLAFDVTQLWALSSANVPLDSPIYSYLDKLAGMGLVRSDVHGLRPYSKAEAARLVVEAEKNLAAQDLAAPTFAQELISRVRDLLPREVSLRERPGKKPAFIDYNPVSSIRLRYVYLDGLPRDYNRDSLDPGHQSAFGFIGGDLRPLSSSIVHTTGTEGTPLLENNNGVIHPKGNSGELRWAAEGYLSDKVTGLLEPSLLASQDDITLRLNRGYIKLGGGGLELLAGRDENWFGPGYRGSTVLTNNAQNFDQIKLSSPEPLDVAWVKRWLGDLKYALIVSRFDQTGSGDTLRRPYFIGFKLAVKPRDWFEYGINFIRQQGGPGFTSKASLTDDIFGGGYTNHNNSIAGFDLRFRVPQLRNTEFYAEYSGEDNAGKVWPIVESYVAGIFIPTLTSSGRDDFRFEYFLGSVMLYGDWKFPAGYVYHNMTPGHSQGTNAQEFFGRYSHWFGVRNNVALEYFYTERGRTNRVPGQVMESKHAGRIFWTVPVHGDVDAQVEYGVEKISNLNLVDGAQRTNQLFKMELRYRY